jgi:hypothetical protein
MEVYRKVYVLCDIQEEEEEGDDDTVFVEVPNPVDPLQKEIIQSILLQTAQYFEKPKNFYFKQSVTVGFVKKFEDYLKANIGNERKDKIRNNGQGIGRAAMIFNLFGEGDFRLVRKLGEGVSMKKKNIFIF